MTSRRFALGAIPLGLLLALGAGGSAMAQQKSQPSQPKEVETITVVAPRITYHERRGMHGSVIPKEITVVKKTAMVSYADLNLSRTADLFVLEDRIDKAAAQVCQDLARELPDGEPDTAICRERATHDAMAHVRRTTRHEVATRP
jgi:UrcA family protein